MKKTRCFTEEDMKNAFLAGGNYAFSLERNHRGLPSNTKSSAMNNYCNDYVQDVNRRYVPKVKKHLTY